MGTPCECGGRLASIRTRRCTSRSRCRSSIRDGTLHVYEGSRRLEGHQRSISLPSGVYLSPSPPALLVISPVTVDCAHFVDMANHKSGTTASPRYGYGYGRGTIDASVLANVVPSDLLPESWIDYSGLDYLAIPRDELERLEHPVRGAILKWVQSGGSLLVYDVGKDADALARLDRLIEYARNVADDVAAP